MTSDCEDCHLPISEPFLTVVQGRYNYHEDCLRCLDCRQKLTGVCYRSEEGIFCEKDYIERSVKCGGCSKYMSHSEPGIKIRPGVIYHPECLKCFICERVLTDRMGIHSTGDPLCPSHMNNHRQDDFEEDESQGSPDNSDSEDKKEEGKRRGPRTTIKAPQLEELQETFAKNPKPSRAIRESLAKKTGLPMRVIQVWFQNKRSKEKRLTSMKMYPHYGQYGYYADNLLPSPPMRAGDYNEFVSSAPLYPYVHPSPPINTITPPPSDEWM